jgi:hypothetical protein
MKYVDAAVLDLGVATAAEAGEMMRRLRAEMPAPFYLVAASRVATPDVVAWEFGDAVSDVPHGTLDEAVARFRQLVPEEHYCVLMGCGGATRATCPKAILDTRIFEKAAGN